MAEYKTDVQVNYGFGLSFEATGKAPVVAKRIWETLADAQTYVDTATDTAIAGLVLTVINDTNASNNGVYFVKSVGDGKTAGVLTKLGSAGDMVSVDPADKVLYAEGTKVKSGITLGYDNTNKTLRLYGHDSSVISEIDCKDFVKDGMLRGSVLYTATGTTGSVTIASETYQLTGLTSGKTYIVLVWNSDAEINPMTIDVTTLIDTYTGGTAITVTDKTINVNKDVVDGWIDTKVNALDSSKTSTDNGYFTVTVTQTDGKIASVSSTSNLGTAVKKAEGDFATAAQGAKANTAVQDVIVGADENYIKVSGKDTNNSVTVSATDALKTAVDNANNGVRSAAGDNYVSASVASNKVSVAATTKLSSAVTKAENSVQYSTDKKSVPVSTDGSVKVTGVKAPDSSTDAANKEYVDSAVKTITDSYVKSFGGKTGAITVKGSTTTGDVNLAMSGNELQASIVGLDSVIDSKVSAHNSSTNTDVHPDIRKAISDEVTRAKEAEKVNSDAIKKLNGDVSTEGSVAKAVADAKTELLGDASTNYNTLGKLEDRIQEVDAKASAAHTVVNAKTDGHVRVSVTKNTTDASVVTVTESDIASDASLSSEITRAKGAEDKIEQSIGLNADGSHITTNGNYTNTATTIAGEIAALDTQVFKNVGNITANTNNIATNTSAITKLNGAESVEGSVRYIAKEYAAAAMTWDAF